jgi:hypothetical protein
LDDARTTTTTTRGDDDDARARTAPTASGGIARELCVVGTAVARMSIEAKGAS